MIKYLKTKEVKGGWISKFAVVSYGKTDVSFSTLSDIDFCKVLNGEIKPLNKYLSKQTKNGKEYINWDINKQIKEANKAEELVQMEG